MKQNLRALWSLVKENRMLYVSAVLSTVITVVIGFLTPLVFSETIDVILSDGASFMPEWLKAPVRAMGGRVFLRENPLQPKLTAQLTA